MPKILKTLKLVPLLFPLLLSSCFDVDEKVEVKADGTTDIRMRTSISDDYLHMAQRVGFKFCDHVLLVASNIQSSYRRSEVDKNIICETEVSGKTDAVFEAMQYITSPGQQSHVLFGAMNMEMHFYHWKDYYQTTLFIPPLPKSGRLGLLGDVVRSVVFAGRTLKYSLSAPGFVETNGKSGPDRKTAFFSIPLWQVHFAQKDAVTFEANFQKTWK